MTPCLDFGSSNVNLSAPTFIYCNNQLVSVLNSDLVSVIIPVYNAEKYLRQAIDSVLNQSHQNLEILAIDDASVDKSVSILESYGRAIRWSSQAHLGAAAARNTGISASVGNFIAFLDADDYWHFEKLSSQLSMLLSEQHLGYVFSLLEQFICPHLDAVEARKLVCPASPQPGYIPGTFLAHRYVFDQVGLLDTQYRVGEFVDWHSRAKNLGIKSAILERVLLYRRLHMNNLSRNVDDSRQDFAKIARAAMLRKKLSN